MSSNRWVAALNARAGLDVLEPSAGVVEEEPDVEVLRGSPAPQPCVTAPGGRHRLGVVTVADRGPWWLGVHGGAGESTMADLLGGTASAHRWPEPVQGGPRPLVVLVARQNARGLDAAGRAARDWASGSRPDVDLLGLVVIAAAPGKTPKPLRARTRVIAGGVPRTWMVPWIDSLHLTGDVTAPSRGCVCVLTNISEAIEKMKEQNQ